MPERRGCRAGVFRDPEIERRMIDYSECQQAAVADSILHFCSVSKRSWPRALLTGVFHGYVFSQFGRQAAGGHLDIARILKSPYIDYLSGPQTYQPFTREVGGTGQSRGLPESCALHGKLWMDEMDQPTHLGAPGDPGYHCTLPDALALLRRNVAHPLLRGHGLWYYDFGPRFSSGWWDDPALIAEIRRLKDFFDARLPRPYESPADVLLVCDTSVFYQTGPSFQADPVSEPSLDQLSAAMYRSGVSFHMVYLSDLEAVDLSRYRAVVFANTWLLTPGQKAFIRDRVACSARHLIFVYAPGYSDGSRLDAEHVSEVVGFGVEPAEADPSRGAWRAAGLFPLPAPLSPVFVVRDPAAEVIERFDGSCLPAVSRRRFADHDSWFCASPPTAPELLRSLFRESGAHIYGDAGDVVVAGWGLLLVHAVEPGSRSLLLRSGRRVEVPLAARSTTLLDDSTGAVVF
jgi:hypothetical protein